MASARLALAVCECGGSASATDWRPPPIRKLGDAPRRRLPAAPARQTRGPWDAAHARALRATLMLLGLAEPRPRGRQALAWHPLIFAIGASCAEPPNDAGLRPFGEGTGELLQRVADALPQGRAGATQPLGFVDEEAQARTALRLDRSWTALLHRDGAAGVAFGAATAEAPLELLRGPGSPLQMAWTAAVDLLVAALDGSGPARLSVLVNGALPGFGRQPLFYVDRTIELVAPSADDVGSVVREIERATADSLPRDAPSA